MTNISVNSLSNERLGLLVLAVDKEIFVTITVYLTYKVSSSCCC